MANQRYLSPTNTHLPIATGTVVGYIRDPREFALPRYCQFVETPSVTGVYYKLDPDHPVRIPAKANFAWAPGARAPQGHANIGDFEIDNFQCERLAFPFTLDQEGVQQAQAYAGWDPVTYEAKAMAQQAMTLRTIDIWSPGGTLQLDTPTNWPSTNTGSAAQLAGNAVGSTWANSTSNLQTIKKSLLSAARIICFLTNGCVRPKDMMVVINPNAAIATAASQEIVDFVKQQASSPSILEKAWDNPNELWGLPNNLYGFPLVVEDAVFVNNYPSVGGNPQVPGTRVYAKADNYAVLLSRVGAIDAPFGARSFSTVQCYWHKYDMAVEAKTEYWDKLEEGRVVDYRTFITPSTITGFNITNILS
jgi:hypothetical protein